MDVLRVLGLIVLLPLALGFVLGTHSYLYSGYAQPLVSAELQDVAWGLFAVAGLSLIAMPIFERVLPLRGLRAVAWPISIWMGLFFFGFLLLAASDLAFRWPLQWAGLWGENAARWRAVALALVLVAVAAQALREGLGGPRDRRVEIVLERWPRERDGYRIVQLSDIHIGPILDRSFAAQLVERANALDPDLVVVTGDLVDGPVATLGEEVEPFARLRGRDGVFFVTGNHDHYSGDSAWVERVRSLGWTPLRNERRTLGSGAAIFELAGVDDHRGGMMPGSEGGEDLDAALRELPEGRPVVLLAHDPSTFKRAHARGIDLQLSGHTHGGQIWPFRYAVRAAIPFVAGRYSKGSAELYVSCGTGFWGPPMRLGTQAEITEIVLRSA